MTDRHVDKAVAYEIVSFHSRYDRSGFDCGEPSVNEWIRTQAGQSERSGGTRTFLAVTEDEILGFYASLAVTMDRDEVAQAFGVGHARYPKPAILLAQMGVITSAQGAGIAKALLVHALEGVLRASQHTGVEVVLVDALNDEVCAFYRKMGFRSLEDHQLRLFMPVKSLRATFESVG